jgi:hypothetical protein
MRFLPDSWFKKPETAADTSNTVGIERDDDGTGDERMPDKEYTPKGTSEDEVRAADEWFDTDAETLLKDIALGPDGNFKDPRLAEISDVDKATFAARQHREIVDMDLAELPEEEAELDALNQERARMEQVFLDHGAEADFTPAFESLGPMEGGEEVHKIAEPGEPTGEESPEENEDVLDLIYELARLSKENSGLHDAWMQTYRTEGKEAALNSDAYPAWQANAAKIKDLEARIPMSQLDQYVSGRSFKDQIGMTAGAEKVMKEIDAMREEKAA